MDIDSFLKCTRSIYGDSYVPLHRPIFEGNERQYLVDCIDSNFVSSVGSKVTEFEEKVATFTGARYAVATVNGTSALQVAMKIGGVKLGDEVISQALTFVATCNAISYLGAHPVFVDVDRDTMGLSPSALDLFLCTHAEKRNGEVFNKFSGRRIVACVPMHTFGLPCRIDDIVSICADWGIAVIEDAAESLGSYVSSRHTGLFGCMGTLSFNGNKIITTGGGGMIITDDHALAKRAKHITTTSKVPHAYEFAHDEVGYNFRMPNLNAALGCAQMEKLNEFIVIKTKLSDLWGDFFKGEDVEFSGAIKGSKTNHWLNAIVLPSRSERDRFLEHTNKNGVMTRPIWRLMSKLPMFQNCQHDGLVNSLWLEDRVVNIPSSVPEGAVKEFSGGIL